jgi:hypothetical protein
MSYKAELVDVMQEFQLYETLNSSNMLYQMLQQGKEVPEEVNNIKKNSTDIEELMLRPNDFRMPNERVERGDRIKVVKWIYWSEPVALMQITETDRSRDENVVRQLKIWRICSKHPSMLKV